MNPMKPSASPLPMTFALPTSLGAPVLLPPAPAGVKRATAGTDPCASLTPIALQNVLDKVAESLAKADHDAAVNGTKATKPGAYPLAADNNRAFVAEAQTNLLFLQSWLKSHGFLDTPFVNNQTAAWNIFNYVRENVYLLHMAQHFATLSVAYNTSHDAFDSYNLTAEAIDLAEALGEPAGRCFCSGYLK
jgi:hypothetical protein